MRMKQFITLPKLNHGDQVGIVSPSSDLAGKFPWVLDLGLQRMRDDFALDPVEYPTTRQLNAPLKDRARDIIAAFTDAKNKAVFATIGGFDQIRLLKYLDPQVFLDNPKPFFGFSDNTHLHNFLWGLGIPSYYGGGVMNQFGMNVKMFDITVQSLNQALFEEGEFDLAVSYEYNDEGLGWHIEKNLQKPRKMDKNQGLFWDGSESAKGVLWGGCVESLIVQSTAAKYLPHDEDLDGTILFLETAEDIPDHWVIEYLLTGFGERGWFDKFQAVLVGRPKAWEFDKQLSLEDKLAYSQAQRNSVIKIVRQYNQRIPIVQNLDVGHTDPQIALPMGRLVQVKTSEKKVLLSY